MNVTEEGLSLRNIYHRLPTTAFSNTCGTLNRNLLRTEVASIYGHQLRGKLKCYILKKVEENKAVLSTVQPINRVDSLTRHANAMRSPCGSVAANPIGKVAPNGASPSGTCTPE